MFDLATVIHESASPDCLDNTPLDPDDLDWDMDEWLTGPPASEYGSPGRRIPNFFSANTADPPDPLASSIPRTFATTTTGFHLKIRPNVTRAEINIIAADFRIPNLYTSIRDFLSHYLYDQETRRISGRQGPTNGTLLPFNEIRVWHSVQLQNYDSNGGLRPPQRLFASPPSDDWPSGRYDTVLFRESVDAGSPRRPGLGLEGQYFACQKQIHRC